MPSTFSSGELTALLEHGDCVEVMRRLPDASMDAIVCDPPAAISFMGKEWDDDKGGRVGWVGWMTEVMREALRVLKPGGHAVVWALPRTSHWTAWALEDAGFEVRDAVLHCFGTGFPKSLDISKAIDKAAGAEREVVGEKGGRYATPKQDFRGGKHHAGAAVPTALFNEVTAPATADAKKWEGWGSALKPSQEIWWLCRKPLDGTLAANTLKHGVGGLNIDGCRVATSHGDEVSLHGRAPTENGWDARWSCTQTPGQTEGQKLGRFPANLLLSHSPSCVHIDTANDTDLWACVPGCPVRALDAQSGTSKSSGGAGEKSRGGMGKRVFGEYALDRNGQNAGGLGDTGGASRFFMRFAADEAPFIYQAKAARKEKEAGLNEQNMLCRCETTRVSWAQEDQKAATQAETGTSPKKVITASTTAGDTEWLTTSYGKNTTELFSADTTFITSTETNSTTESKTSQLSQKSPTNDFIQVVNCETEFGGNPAPSAEITSQSTPTIGTSPQKVGPSTDVADPAISKSSSLKNVRVCPVCGKREKKTAAGEAVGRKEGTVGISSPSAGAGRSAKNGVWCSHPTVKPVAVMQYLARLITPPGGWILDPFMGSGTTGVAAAKEGFNFLGIEKEAEYFAIAEARIGHAHKES